MTFRSYLIGASSALLLLSEHGTAHALPGGDGPGGYSVTQDARLLQKEPSVVEGPRDRGFVLGARGGGGVFNSRSTGVISHFAVTVDLGYDFAPGFYFGGYVMVGVLPSNGAEARYAFDIDVHPLGTATLSPSFGLSFGYEELKDDRNGGVFLEVPLGLDFRAPETSTRWGFFLAPAVGRNFDVGWDQTMTVGARGAI
jgi:hypothetical protein